MYREVRIPRLRAALWVSVPDVGRRLSTSGGIHRSVVAAGTTASDHGEDGATADVIVPDGCMDLIVLDSGVVIAGADSTARRIAPALNPAVGLRFDSGILPQLLTTSAAELADRVTPLGDVVRLRPLISGSHGAGPMMSAAPTSSTLAEVVRTWVDGASGLWDDRGLPGGDGGTQAAVFGESVERLVRIGEALVRGTEIDRRPLELASALAFAPESPASTIAEVAADFAYSPRQLRRLSGAWFGYGPKHLAKILRWRTARKLLDAGHTRTSAAARAGYADASHFWRDERSLLGR